MTAHEAKPVSAEKQILKVYLGRYCFAVDIRLIESVIERRQRTPVPLAASCVTGLLNLRGHVVTEIDMAQILDIARDEDDNTTQIEERALIIVHKGERYSVPFDLLGDVMSVKEDDIVPLPATIGPKWQKLSQGIWHKGEGLVILLDLAYMIDYLIECRASAAKPSDPHA